MLIFDRRGAGQSAGRFNTASFDDLAGDGAAAYDYLSSRPEIDPQKIGLYGISQGGWIAPLIAASRPTTAFLVIVSGCGVTPARQMDFSAVISLRQAGYTGREVAIAMRLRALENSYYRGQISGESLASEIKKFENAAWFEHAYVDSSSEIPPDYKSAKWFFEMDYDPLPVWERVRCPSLFLYAEQDRWVPAAESTFHLKNASRHLQDTAFFRVPGADHMMAENSAVESISGRYLEILTAWLASRLA